jgi:hypothetical protein
MPKKALKWSTDIRTYKYEPIAFVKQNAGNKVHSPPKRRATAQPTVNGDFKVIHILKCNHYKLR